MIVKNKEIQLNYLHPLKLFMKLVFFSNQHLSESVVKYEQCFFSNTEIIEAFVRVSTKTTERAYIKLCVSSALYLRAVCGEI